MHIQTNRVITQTAWNICFNSLIHFFSVPVVLRPSLGHHLILEVSRPHNGASHSAGLAWTGDHLLAVPDNAQHFLTDIHVARGNRTLNLSREVALDLRLRPRDHWDRLDIFIFNFFMFCWPCILVQLWVNDQRDAQLRYIIRLLL